MALELLDQGSESLLREHEADGREHVFFLEFGHEFDHVSELWEIWWSVVSDLLELLFEEIFGVHGFSSSTCDFLESLFLIPLLGKIFFLVLQLLPLLVLLVSLALLVVRNVPEELLVVSLQDLLVLALNHGEVTLVEHPMLEWNRSMIRFLDHDLLVGDPSDPLCEL